eukprot:jgi/Psemu1/301355/fgenesh1_kg.31_\
MIKLLLLASDDEPDPTITSSRAGTSRYDEQVDASKQNDRSFATPIAQPRRHPPNDAANHQQVECMKMDKPAPSSSPACPSHVSRGL